MKSLKAILVGLVVLGAVRAQAEYLLWSLDWDDVSEDAKYAAIVVLDGDNQQVATLNWVSPDDDTVTGTKVKRNADSDPVEVAAVIPSDSAYKNDPYKFVLQVYDSGKNVINSDFTPASYSALSDSIWGGNMNPGVSTSWSPATYVPEPASGTLFIVGALMLFRRKRA